ncbi:DUF3304 domain-containing protein [Chromobacterium violaceum]|uniref:DUF3304 domain-containing protein n=1 Tax=Chromobacterium violaceum (strain ATCC 12472 / DSM 30191 / JCM 1249 / CCUG 213 / NBRC 12614 / NCIMB 9131 / NCTC 9757 / MK) TaxID=243365 RepID=Q7NR13_CHRVO|nr:DUF3304 domain-containing protein [Chromobacterium violaceum]AAQ61634.1 conserved hypothetical protein [Chromobacterium violaceum ATCC 12472]MBT2869616.1 DUF3304 domain-containing protein [Chromobacterium violaceum]SUX89079.1 Protein of uncharacterised function (DUF3304) [Chromobacterium violaceum]
MWRKWWMLPLLAVLAACQSMGEPKMMGGAGRVINTDNQTSIVWAKFNGQGIAGSGGDDCCIEYPAKWQPGMTATVEWMKDPRVGLNADGSKRPRGNLNGSLSEAEKVWVKAHEAQYTRHAAIVSVPQYNKTCGVTLIFLPCDEARVIIDCKQYFDVIQTLPGGARRYPELIRRLGGQQTCRK